MLEATFSRQSVLSAMEQTKRLAVSQSTPILFTMLAVLPISLIQHYIGSIETK